MSGFEIGQRVEWHEAWNTDPHWLEYVAEREANGRRAPDTIKIGTVSEVDPDDGQVFVEWDEVCWESRHATQRRMWCEPSMLAPLDPTTVPTPRPLWDNERHAAAEAEVARLRARLVALGYDPDED